MSNRRKPILPESYAHLLLHAVEVPILIANGVKCWLTFYGLTSSELVAEHVRTAMERRGLQPHQYSVTAFVKEGVT